MNLQKITVTDNQGTVQEAWYHDSTNLHHLDKLLHCQRGIIMFGDTITIEPVKQMKTDQHEIERIRSTFWTRGSKNRRRDPRPGFHYYAFWALVAFNVIIWGVWLISNLQPK
jgi:hypothetical protein